jgi:predicted transcriptional regulator
MNSQQKKQAEAFSALPAADRARLERLAALAQSSPEDIWPVVWRYGFDDIEDSIQADLEGQEDIAAGRTISNEEVMAQALRIVEANVQRKRKIG